MRALASTENSHKRTSGAEIDLLNVQLTAALKADQGCPARNDRQAAVDAS